MDKKSRNSRRRPAALLLALSLSLSLLCACGVKPGQDGSQPSRIPVDYEQFTKESLQIQKSFDELTDRLFREEIAESTIDLHYNLTDPSAYGITENPITYGDFSLEAMKEDTAKLRDLQSQLEGIDCIRLTKDQQLTYKILDSYINTELGSEGLELYAQPLTPTIGVQAQLPVLLAEYAFYNKQDVENYLGLLAQTDVYFGQLLDFEKLKSEAGLFICDTAAGHVLESCEPYLLPPDHSFLAETFDERIDALEGLTDEEKAAYKAQNLQVLAEHFVPAYQSLKEGITALMGTGTNTNTEGLCSYPQGKQYYEYLVRSSTGTSYSAVDDLKKAIEDQISSDLNAMSRSMKEHPDALEGLDTYQFRYKEPTEILEDLKKQITEDFPELPACTYTVKYVPTALQNSLSPAFYLVPPLDRFEDNVIYINGAEKFRSDDLYPTLAHEGYPGHLYQTVYFINKGACPLRHIMSFSSYSEGWATYVENYSYTMDNGIDPNLGALLAHNSSVTLALHALLDIYINYDGWNRDQVHDYLSQYYDVDGTDVVESIYSALTENPTNYLEYYVGYLEILNMRDEAMEALGSQFSLKEFHRFLLDIGPAPFSVIRPLFQTWLLTGGL